MFIYLLFYSMFRSFYIRPSSGRKKYLLAKFCYEKSYSFKISLIKCLFVFLALQPIVFVFSTTRWRALASSFSRFLDHTQRRATVGRSPLDEWSIRRRDLYLTTHNIHNRKTSMPSVGFEPTISAGERPKTYDLDCTATGTGGLINYVNYLLFPTNK
jgi:hypothetical protein